MARALNDPIEAALELATDLHACGMMDDHALAKIHGMASATQATNLASVSGPIRIATSKPLRFRGRSEPYREQGRIVRMWRRDCERLSKPGIAEFRPRAGRFRSVVRRTA